MNEEIEVQDSYQGGWMNSGIKYHLDLLGYLDFFRRGSKTGKIVVFLYNTKNTLLPAGYSCYDSYVLHLIQHPLEILVFCRGL